MFKFGSDVKLVPYLDNIGAPLLYVPPVDGSIVDFFN